MKSFFRNLSTCFPFFVRRPSALERAVRQSPKSRRLGMEPLENRALLAVDAFGGAASLADSNVEESWGPDPEPAVFSASELSTDAAETTISLAALNSVPYGPYVTSEQAALIALRSNATLADETLADFGVLWDEADVETSLAETETDGETLSGVAEALAFESLDLGEIEQEPLPGDASVMSGSSGSSGQNGQGDGSGDQGTVNVDLSGGNTYSGAMATNSNSNPAENKVCVIEAYGRLDFTITGPEGAYVIATVDEDHECDFAPLPRAVELTNGVGSISFQTIQDAWEDDEVATIFFSVDGHIIETWTVTILGSPEFISDADSGTSNTAINDDYVTTGFNTHTLSNDPVVYVPQIHAPDGRALNYTLSDYSLPTYLQGPQGNDGHFYYDSSSQQDGSRFGRETFTLTARYALDTSFSDEISVTIAWADVDKAKSDLAVEHEAFLANDGLLALLTPDQRASQLEINLRNLASFDHSPEDLLSRTNVSYAIRTAECLSQNGLPYAVKVTYCDGSVETYGLDYPDDQK